MPPQPNVTTLAPVIEQKPSPTNATSNGRPTPSLEVIQSPVLNQPKPSYTPTPPSANPSESPSQPSQQKPSAQGKQPPIQENPAPISNVAPNVPIQPAQPDTSIVPPVTHPTSPGKPSLAGLPFNNNSPPSNTISSSPLVPAVPSIDSSVPSESFPSPSDSSSIPNTTPLIDSAATSPTTNYQPTLNTKTTAPENQTSPGSSKSMLPTIGGVIGALAILILILVLIKRHYNKNDDLKKTQLNRNYFNRGTQESRIASTDFEYLEDVSDEDVLNHMSKTTVSSYPSEVSPDRSDFTGYSSTQSGVPSNAGPTSKYTIQTASSSNYSRGKSVVSSDIYSKGRSEASSNMADTLIRGSEDYFSNWDTDSSLNSRYATTIADPTVSYSLYSDSCVMMDEDYDAKTVVIDNDDDKTVISDSLYSN